MERVVRLAQLWNWLPAFRVVAETQHLPTAARALGLSPSALSRSVTQLEGVLDQPLFVRTKSRMQLNHAGETLLASVRDAMRRVDDGVEAIAAGEAKPVRIATDAIWLGMLVAPAIEVPRCRLEHIDLAAVGVREALLRGAVDLAIVEGGQPQGPELLVEHLGALDQSVCVAARRQPTEFAVRTDLDDGWPSTLARSIALRAPRLESILAACRSGAVRAVLPTVIARAHDLQTIASPQLPATQLYLARRRPLDHDPLRGLSVAIRQRATALLTAR